MAGPPQPISKEWITVRNDVSRCVRGTASKNQGSPPVSEQVDAYEKQQIIASQKTSAFECQGKRLWPSTPAASSAVLLRVIVCNPLLGSQEVQPGID